MTIHQNIASPDAATEAFAWVGAVLNQFALGEQALGHLSKASGLSIANGSLGSLEGMRKRLGECGDRRAQMLDKRIGRWMANRPVRHLLAHGTISVLYDVAGQAVVVTRHLPNDGGDVSFDRVWTRTDQLELLRQVTNDSRSISDHVRNLLAEPVVLGRLRRA